MAKKTRTVEEDVKRAVRRAGRAKKAGDVSIGMMLGGLALFYLVMKVWSNRKNRVTITPYDEVTI